jgi:Thioredoxin-like domain
LRPLYLIKALNFQFWKRIVNLCLLGLISCSLSAILWGTPPALATINDDRYDGNIFLVYAGNGALVPPRLNLAQSLKRKRPAVLVFYVDDSKDCKQFAFVVSRLQEYYDKAASLIPVAVDSVTFKSNYTPEEPGYYYQGGVPQTVVIDQNGEVVFNETGKVKYEEIDDVLRKIFDLLPRSETAELKPRAYNEFNAELR